jgi:hypothetical protein
VNVAAVLLLASVIVCGVEAWMKKSLLAVGVGLLAAALLVQRL